jgi:hypothetical protein
MPIRADPMGITPRLPELPEDDITELLNEKNLGKSDMRSTMSLRIFSPEMDDISKLMEDEERYQVYVDNIGKSKTQEPNHEMLADFRLAPDPMEYLRLESDNPSLQEISSEESSRHSERD